MFRLTLKGLAANKVRFALTTFGVILAVSFVVSAFVLADGLRSSFTTVSEDITAGIDLEVRNTADFGDAQPLPAQTVAAVAAVDGVADAVASIEAGHDLVRPILANGESITTDGPPQLAFNWIDNPSLSAFTLVDGSPPEVGEFTIDLDSAAKHGFVIGDNYDLIIPSGRTNLTLSGTSSFGADNATLGAVLMQMNTDQASEMFGIDGIDGVAVEVADGSDITAVQTAIAAAVPTAEVVDNATVLEETTSEFTDEIDIIGNILLGFGGIALFVSMFIIYNTFAIVLGQRIRELALLRTIGADPKQIRRSVLGEALVVGVLASAGGLLGGIGVAKGLEALFGLMGADLPNYPLILATRTIVTAIVIGIGMTMLAAMGPARKASTIPPIAAMRGVTQAKPAGSRTRKISGFGLFGFGIVAGAIGLSGAGSTTAMVTAMGLGAVCVFLGVTLLSPLAVGVITNVFGWPMRKIAGVAGNLAQKNAARNSRRTATTAAALMIGLALVTTALVVGQSIKTTLGATIADSSRADYFLTDQLEEADFPETLAAEIRTDDTVAAASGISYIDARIDGTVSGIATVEFDQVEALMNLDIQEGMIDPMISNSVLVSVDEAESNGAQVGDSVVAEFSNGSAIETTIVGLFDDQALVSQDYLFNNAALDSVGIGQSAEWIAISLIPNADSAAVDTLMADLAEQYPQADVETAEAFIDRIEGMIDEMLAIVNVMVALAVIIALIGIANTLALSVFERTRELGLIRAVGMTRRQLRRMVRFEAALVAIFGAVLGVGTGLLFGWALAAAMPTEYASAVAIPTTNILILMLVAAMAGVVAAWLPARRAGRLNVLEAIAN